jgi:hypothetical protein
MSARIDYHLIGRTQDKLRTHAARASEYTRTGLWLIADFFRNARWRVVPVILYGTLHIAVKFAAMGVIYLCVHALSEDLPIDLPGLAALTPKSPVFVVSAVAVGVVLLIATAFFRYLVRQRGISLGRQYEEHCARRLFQLASRLPDPRAPLASRIVESGGIRQYFGYLRPCNLTVRQLTQLLPTCASFVAVSAALLWMDLWLTVALAGLAGLAVVAQYPANHRVASASHVLERTKRAATRRYRALLRRLDRDPIPLAPDGALLNRLFRSGQVRDNIDSFSARATQAEHAALVSRIGSSLLLGAILILLGVDIVQGDRTWAGVAAYAAAVRFALSDFVSVCQIASSLTKYHAQIANHREFVLDALPCLVDARTEVPTINWPITFHVPGLRDPAAALVAAPGTILAVVAPGQASALLPALLQTAIEPATPDGRSPRPVVVDSEILAPDLDLRTNFGVPADLSEAVVEEALAPFAPDSNGGVYPRGWLDRSLDELGSLPRWLLEALPVISVHARRRPIVVIIAARLASMSRPWRDACLAALADSVVLLLHTRPTAVGDYGEQAAILCDGRALRGWLPVEHRRSEQTQRRSERAKRRAEKAERRAERAQRREIDRPAATVPKIPEPAAPPPTKTLTQHYDEMIRTSAAPIVESFAPSIDDDLDEDDE